MSDAIENLVRRASMRSSPKREEVARPKRRADESPVQYYRRAKCVDDNFTRRWRGWYYCNPAHCKHRWRSKSERDNHLSGAYAIL